MTIIVSFPFFKQTVVIADSRVSYQGYPEKADDVLQKLYPFYNPALGSRVVIGFSGSLLGAYKVLEEIRKTAKTYSKPSTATSFASDLIRWIKHEYTELSPSERCLSFLIAGVEPNRDTSKNKPEWIGHIPYRFTITLRPSKDLSKLVEGEEGFIQAIGYKNDKFIEKCHEILIKYFGDHYKYPRFALQAIITDLNLHFAREGIKEVGGMLQCFILGTEGVQPFPYSDLNKFLLTFENGGFIQIDKEARKRVPLISITEWGKNRHRKELQPGKFGPFINPIYEEIIEKEKRPRKLNG